MEQSDSFPSHSSYNFIMFFLMILTKNDVFLRVAEIHRAAVAGFGVAWNLRTGAGPHPRNRHKSRNAGSTAASCNRGKPGPHTGYEAGDRVHRGNLRAA